MAIETSVLNFLFVRWVAMKETEVQDLFNWLALDFEKAGFINELLTL